MVKNTQGGSKHKSQARKANNFDRNITIEPNGPGEKYAKVTKMFGNGMCQVELQDEKTDLVCHIRGKFRGKNKKHNNVTVNSIVVVGLREWESSLKNCDLIGVVSSGSSAVLGIGDEDTTNDEFVFGDDEVVPQQNIPDGTIMEDIIGNDDDDIDIDDI